VCKRIFIWMSSYDQNSHVRLPTLRVNLLSKTLLFSHFEQLLRLNLVTISVNVINASQQSTI
jgi:hypothetical protein